MSIINSNKLQWNKSTFSFSKTFSFFNKENMSLIMSDILLIEKNKKIQILLQPSNLELEVIVSFDDEKKDKVYDVLLKIEDFFESCENG